MLKHERALPQIIENKRRKRDGEPPHPDGERAEVPEVRIYGFTARYDEHQRAKGYEDAICFRFPQKGDGVSGIEGHQDIGMGLDLPHAQHGQDNKPDDEDGAENRPHPRRPSVLHGEEQRENGNRDWDDGPAEHRRRDLKALHRRQHADGG